MSVNLKLHINSTQCNHWPYIKIILNDITVFDAEVTNSTDICLNLDDIKESNRLVIKHHSKSFGENRVWDTKVDSNGNIIEDCSFQITNIAFNDVEFNELAYKKIFFQYENSHDPIYLNSLVGFNGEFVIAFTRDIYSWLTLLKFKHDIITDEEQFTNITQLYHYEKEVPLINEIKDLLKLR